MSQANNYSLPKQHVAHTLTYQRRVTKSNLHTITSIRVLPTAEEIPVTDRESTKSHICRAVAERAAINLMRTGQFARTGHLDQVNADELIFALRHIDDVAHFNTCLSKELGARKSKYTISVRIVNYPEAEGKPAQKDYFVDCFDLTGCRVDGFVHRLGAGQGGRGLSMSPARRWMRLTAH